MTKIRFGERSIALPKSRGMRITLGSGLTVAGALGGWLPILGFWMVPLGLLILSVDIPGVRNRRRKVTVRVLRWWRGSKPSDEEARSDPLRDTKQVP